MRKNRTHSGIEALNGDGGDDQGGGLIAMRTTLLAAALIFLPISTVSQTVDSGNVITLGRNFKTLHMDSNLLPSDRRVQLLEPNKHEDYDLELIYGMLGYKNPGPNLFESIESGRLPRLPFETRRSSNLKNAIAIIDVRNPANQLIVYDVFVFAGIADKRGSRLFALAHELGHHVCGHMDGSRILPSHTRELEADKFAGAAMAQLKKLHPKFDVTAEIPLIQASFNKDGSSSHPPVDQRIAAFQEGLRGGSNCRLKR